MPARRKSESNLREMRMAEQFSFLSKLVSISRTEGHTDRRTNTIMDPCKEEDQVDAYPILDVTF